MEVCSLRKKIINTKYYSEILFPAFFGRIFSVNKYEEKWIASCIFYTPSVSGKVQCLREKEKKVKTETSPTRFKKRAMRVPQYNGKDLSIIPIQ